MLNALKVINMSCILYGLIYTMHILVLCVVSLIYMYMDFINRKKVY